MGVGVGVGVGGRLLCGQDGCVRGDEESRKGTGRKEETASSRVRSRKLFVVSLQ